MSDRAVKMLDNIAQWIVVAAFFVVSGISLFFLGAGIAWLVLYRPDVLVAVVAAPVIASLGWLAYRSLGNR